jgi:hypothetical protein
LVAREKDVSMSDDGKVQPLLDRLQGWRVVSAIPVAGGLEVRLGHRREQFDARAVLLIDDEGSKEVAGRLLDEPLEVTAGGLSLGDITFGIQQVVQGQILETAAWRIPGPPRDPVEHPDVAASGVVESGVLVWPEVDDLPEDHDPAGTLGGLVHQAFAASPLIVTVTRQEPSLEADRSQMFLTPWTAVEARVHHEHPDSMIVVLFPIGEVLGRLWERAGLHRDLSGATGATDVAETTVRISYADDEGVSLGALGWETTTDGTIVASDGERSAASIAAELLTMLPSAAEAPAEYEMVEVSS